MIKLETKRIIIRDHITDDIKSHHKLLSDDEIMYYLEDIKTSSFEESKKNLLDSINYASNPTREFVFLKMVEKNTNEHIGEIGYTVTYSKNNLKNAHLGYFTYPTFWNQGYVTEAVKELIRFAFEEDNVKRITTGCLAENIGSEYVMKKCGLKKTNETLVSHNKKMKSRVEYSVLKSEWQSRHLSTE